MNTASSRPYILFLLGVSGAGKGTLRKRLINENNDYISIVPSYVTRPMRAGETQGDPYHFVDRETFISAIQDNTILEYNEYAGNYYGTALHLLRDVQHSGKMPLKELDTNGLVMLKNTNAIPGEYITFFLSLDSETARKRLEQRGDTQNIDERIALQTAEKEVAQKYCDHIIDASGTPDDVYDTFMSIVLSLYNDEKKI